VTALGQARVTARSHRLILSRYPTAGVSDGLADDEAELRIAFALEAATNPRLTEAKGRLRRLPPGESPTAPEGQGVHLAMAVFLHTSEGGSRFSDRDLGAWYAALEIETAMAETL